MNTCTCNPEHLEAGGYDAGCPVHDKTNETPIHDQILIVPEVDPAEVSTMKIASELKVADRCDTGACGAQAFVLTVHSGHDLRWCAHHYESACKQPGSTLAQHIVIDARPTINKAASISANV